MSPIGSVGRSVRGRRLPDAIPDSVIEQTDIHFDAMDADSVVTSDGLVTAWNDQQGVHDLDTASASDYASEGINGHPAILFDGVDDYLENTAYSNTQPLTTFLVIQLESTTGRQRIYDDSSSKNVITWWDAGNWGIFLGGDVGTGSTDSTIQQLTSVMDGGDTKLREEGVQTLSGSGDAGSDFDGITVGARGEGTDDYWNGYIGEFRVVDGTLSTEDIEQYERHLINKWSI